MSVEMPVVRLVVGEHYDIEHFNSDYKVGVDVPPEDIIRLRAHIAMMDEVSSFSAMLANFNKKFIETYPLATGDITRIWIGRGTNKPQIFLGRVEELDAEATAMENYLTLKGRCIGEDLYRRLVTEIYLNQKAEDVVRHLIDNYSRLKRQRDGVDLVEDTDTTYTELEYDKTKLKDVLDFIAKTADKAGVIGYDYRVEYDGTFAFFPRGTKTSPINLTDVIHWASYRKTVHRIRNRIYVYGAAEKAAPADKDAWTESLTPTDGSWSANGGGTPTVSLDSSTKFEGSYSIKLTCDNWGQAIFTFAEGKEMDTNLFPKLFFHIRRGAGLVGGSIYLEDADGEKAWRELSVFQEDEWCSITVDVGRKSEGWDRGRTWDGWSKIRKVIIALSGEGLGLSFWVDKMFFGGARFGVSSPHEGCSVAIPQEDISDPSDIRELMVTDEELVSDAECVARAKALLDWLKDEAESLTIQTEILDFGNNRLQPGDMIQVVLPNENVNGYYRILTVDYQLGETQELPITIELGKETPLLADYLYHLIKETSTMARLKKGGP